MTDFQKKERQKIREAQKLHSKAGWMGDIKSAGMFLIGLGLVFLVPGLLAALHPDAIWPKVTSFLWTGGVLLFCGLLLYRPFTKKEEKYSKAAEMVRRGMGVETALSQTADVFQKSVALETQEKQYFEENKEDLAEFYADVQKILVEKYHFRADKVFQAQQDSHIIAGHATLQGKTPGQIALQIYDYFRIRGELKNPDIFVDTDWQSYEREKDRHKKRGRIAIAVIAVFFLALFYGWFLTDGYVPTESWREIYLAASGCFAVAVYIWLAHSYLSGKMSHLPAPADWGDKAVRLSLFLIWAVLFYLGLTVVIGHTPGHLATRFVDTEPVQQHYLFHKRKKGKPAFQYCMDKREIYTGEKDFIGKYCTGQTDAVDAPQALLMLCHVQTSWFGTIIGDCRIEKSKE